MLAGIFSNSEGAEEFQVTNSVPSWGVGRGKGRVTRTLDLKGLKCLRIVLGLYPT